MAAPSTSLATLRPDLGGSMEAFDLQADREGFIGLRVLPVFEAAKKSGIFGKIPLDQLLQNRDTQRAPGSGYNRGRFTFTSASYACEEHGAEEPVDDGESTIYRDFFDAEEVAAERARDVVLRNYEKRVAALVFATGTWTPTEVATEWSTVATATPINDVITATQAVWAASGLWPNALIISRKVYLNLIRCAEILDKIKSVQGVLPGQVGIAQLQAAFDLPFILVGGGAKNAADEGQTATVGEIWDDEYAMVARVATRPKDIREPCLGRTLHWGADGSQIGAVIESYRDEPVRSDIIRARMDTDELIFHSAAGHLLGNITA